MNCKEQDELVAYLDGELDDARAAAIRGHLEVCGDCRKRLDLLRRSYAALEAIEPVVVPADFARRVKSRVHKRLLRIPAYVGSVFAVAAAVLLVITFYKGPHPVAAPKAATPIVANITPEVQGVVENMDVLENYDVLSNLDMLKDYDTLTELDKVGGTAAI